MGRELVFVVDEIRGFVAEEDDGSWTALVQRGDVKKDETGRIMMLDEFRIVILRQHSSRNSAIQSVGELIQKQIGWPKNVKDSASALIESVIEDEVGDEGEVDAEA